MIRSNYSNVSRETFFTSLHLVENRWRLCGTGRDVLCRYMVVILIRENFGNFFRLRSSIILTKYRRDCG